MNSWIKKILRKLYMYIPNTLKVNIALSPYIKKKDYLRNKDKITKYRNIHYGKRCFIIGTGPSLNNTNLSLIKDEISFGLNTFYTGLKRFRVTPSYWSVSDEAVLKVHYKNILSLSVPIFISGSAAEFYTKNRSHFETYCKNQPILIRYLGPMWKTKIFSSDISKGAYGGDTVIIDICIQLAFYMGFKSVYLIGCDCDYSGSHRFDLKKSENKTTPAIEGDFSRIFNSYEVCNDFFESQNKKIINCTVGGKLEIFNRITLEQLMKKDLNN